MPKRIDRNKTIEDQIWDDIAPRVNWFRPKQISIKIRVPITTVRHLCEAYYNRDILDKKVVDKTNYYRVKP